MVAIIRFSSVVGLASALALQSSSYSQAGPFNSWREVGGRKQSGGEVGGRKESGGQVSGRKMNDSDEIPDVDGSDEIPDVNASDEIPEEDFIPLVSPEISTRDRRYICKHERGKEYTDDWESLDVHVLKGIGVRTRWIACPKTDEWDAFRIQFGWAEPGDGAGSDPLSSLDDSTFRGILDTLYPPVKGGQYVCPLVRKAMKREYGTFINLCR
ncbi:hypothetical protein FOZ61_008462, partial [Perkinsus olseni]